jgi:hypothetical protein
MTLNVDSLEKAVAALERSVKAVGDSTLQPDDPLLEAAQAGIVQQFEIAYELARKLLQHWLSLNQGLAEDDLLADPDLWFEFGNARNLTAHTYDDKQAQAVRDLALRFLTEVRSVLQRLRAQHD